MRVVLSLALCLFASQVRAQSFGDPQAKVTTCSTRVDSRFSAPASTVVFLFCDSYSAFGVLRSNWPNRLYFTGRLRSNHEPDKVDPKDPVASIRMSKFPPSQSVTCLIRGIGEVVQNPTLDCLSE